MENPVANNPPTVAAGVATLIGGLGMWAVMALPASAPAAVGAGIVILTLAVGAGCGKVAQRWTTRWFGD